MNDDANADVFEQLGTILSALDAVMEHQETFAKRLDAQAQSLAAIAVAIGHTFIATGTTKPLPQDVLEDPAFKDFLDHYPLDGPPIIGQAKMDELVAQLDNEAPAKLAGGFRELERMATLSQFERIRNRQVERAARAKYGDLEALEKGKDR
jgi:hypothetical protein